VSRRFGASTNLPNFYAYPVSGSPPSPLLTRIYRLRAAAGGERARKGGRKPAPAGPSPLAAKTPASRRSGRVRVDCGEGPVHPRYGRGLFSARASANRRQGLGRLDQCRPPDITRPLSRDGLSLPRGSQHYRL
jgi:hypothetical protein